MKEGTMKYLFGHDRLGGPVGPRRSRLAYSLTHEALENLEALKSSGEVEISASEAAKALGGSRQRFAKMVTDGKVKAGEHKLMNLSSLMKWVAAGIAISAGPRRSPMMAGLDWMRDE